jgi:hypothetical protein
MSRLEFDAIIQSPDDAPKAAFITAPFDVKELFGTKGRIAVKGTIDDEPLIFFITIQTDWVFPDP